MGCTGSKKYPPHVSRDLERAAMAEDATPYRRTSVQQTTQIITRTVQTKSSQNAASSQILTSTTRTSNGEPRAYVSVYKRPSLSAPVDEPLFSSPITRARSPAITVKRFPELKAQLPAAGKTKTTDKAYDLSDKAYVLVFHHYKFQDTSHNREGSIYDMASIRKYMQNYRCDTLDVNENYTKQRVINKLQDISKKDFSKYSCILVFIMSHGNTNDTIMAYDGQMYGFHEDVVERCTQNATLKDKPKIFVLQACRGNAEIVTDARRVMSDKSDIVTFQSSYQGAVSYRNTKEGSFFMQAFLRLLHEHNQHNIINVNTELNKHFNEKQILQTPTLSTTLRKELIFGHLLRKR
uniref:Caspase family p20 domain-containing protein n=1 Tax=Anopheles farauti TaxID=69004 RepID=A0A182QN42_9DIPT